ncbi:hypothetical protein EV421DRAFT_602564 [Armillaria borealis]|uniref:Uncharacterized protein n=1 Tax=Armillaria borealis TaxID=47425 RepID=A0AA39M629_9AGAR|nr:hypothetical protein EV421DRAFT_602564 [Armillaria borealis]
MYKHSCYASSSVVIPSMPMNKVVFRGQAATVWNSVTRRRVLERAMFRPATLLSSSARYAAAAPWSTAGDVDVTRKTNQNLQGKRDKTNHSGRLASSLPGTRGIHPSNYTSSSLHDKTPQARSPFNIRSPTVSSTIAIICIFYFIIDNGLSSRNREDSPCSLDVDRDATPNRS